MRVLSVELAAIKEQRNQTKRELQKVEKSEKQTYKLLEEEKACHK